MFFRFVCFVFFYTAVIQGAICKDPDWMVNIETQFGDETITGVGYIVQVGEKYYVRTASHVTMGSNSVKLASGKNEQLKVTNDPGSIDNNHDDQLIPIKKPKKSKSIAFYSPTINRFVVWPSRSKEIKSTPRRKEVEKSLDAGFYIIPQSLQKNKKDQKFKELDEGLFNGFSPSMDYSNYLRPVKGGASLTADIKVVPGESGSPLFKDMLVGYNIQDMDGKHYEYPLPQMSGGATILIGHTQSYQRYVDRSNFSSSEQSERIVSNIGKKADETKWGRYNGIFYRYKNTNEGLIQEINILSSQSGNTTGGNGGNTTGGNGGNTTGGNGGNTTGGNGGNTTGGNGGNTTGGNGGNTTGGNGGNTTGGNGGNVENDTNNLPDILTGMIYKDKAIIAFKVNVKNLKTSKTESFTLFADWENYQYLEDLKNNENLNVKVESQALTSKKLGELVLEKAEKQSTDMGSRSSRCSIDKNSLTDGYLRINIQPFEPVTIKLDQNFFPIVEMVNPDTKKVFKMDIRGLFSVDAMELVEEERKGISEFNFYENQSYVLVKGENTKYSRIKCRAISGLSDFSRKRFFGDNPIVKEATEKVLDNGNSAQSK